MQEKTIAVLGAGHMGGALLRGMLKAHWSDPARLVATGPRKDRLEAFTSELGIRTTTDNREAAEQADVVVLGVKPQILRRVLDEIQPVVTRRKLVVSIAAGVATETIESSLQAGVPVIRTMPNVPVTVEAGATAMCRGVHATEEHARVVRAIFESVGTVVEVEEYLMDAVTGLSGTGPMYVFQILEGLCDAGVKVGLSRHVATELAVQTMLGAAKMAKESGKHPGVLKDMVTSPGGTAITALHTMERNGLRALLIDAVEAATRRSAELGELVNKGGRQPKAR